LRKEIEEENIAEKRFFANCIRSATQSDRIGFENFLAQLVVQKDKVRRDDKERNIIIPDGFSYEEG